MRGKEGNDMNLTSSSIERRVTLKERRKIIVIKSNSWLCLRKGEEKGGFHQFRVYTTTTT